MEGLYISFNGGKDATAALFLTLIALQNSPLASSPLKCIYFKEPNSFEEVNTFITSIRNDFHLDWFEFETKNYAGELAKFAQQRPLQYVIMGTRKDDPHCQNLKSVSASDQQKGYPPFLRVNPLIDWNYDQVWNFIKGFSLPYCKLYDQGYTYLGNKNNTIKNQELYDPKNKNYKSAFEAQACMEQKSRIKPESPKPEQP